MNTRIPPDRRDRFSRLFGRLLTSLMLVVVGCGPGTGGTGNGETSAGLQDFGATPASVCSSVLAAALDCPPASSAPVVGQPGTRRVLFSDTTHGDNIAVRIEDDRLELAARCLGLRFEGDWGITAQHGARFFGSYTTGTSPQSAPASLSVQTAPGAVSATDLIATLRDVDGRVLLGPVSLQRVAAPVTDPAGCPR